MTENTKVVYRTLADFVPAMKSAKSLAKGNEELGNLLQLVGHLAYKTPGGSVGWTKGTTPTVIATAIDAGADVGLPLPEALGRVFKVAEKVATKEQKEAVVILKGIMLPKP